MAEEVRVASAGGVDSHRSVGAVQLLVPQMLFWFSGS